MPNIGLLKVNICFGIPKYELFVIDKGPPDKIIPFKLSVFVKFLVL